jgi:transposase-like protein
VDTTTTDKVVRRRQYSAAFKAQVVAECDVPGASVAKVALAHGIQSNIVHGWHKLARGPPAVQSPQPTQFVPHIPFQRQLSLPRHHSGGLAPVPRTVTC